MVNKRDNRTPVRFVAKSPIIVGVESRIHQTKAAGMLANAQAQILQFFQTNGIIAVLVVILAVGIWRIGLRLLTARQRGRTAKAFRERFQAFANSMGRRQCGL